MTSTTTFGDYQLRQTVLADVPTLSALEWTCQPDPWHMERIEAFIAEPHEGHEQFGLVALLRGRPVGYAILAIGGGNISIERIGVLPNQRRQRVGTKLIALSLLEARGRDLAFIVTVLRESNVAAQKFFYECGFRAGRIADPLKHWFGTEDGVAMRRPVVLPMPSAERHQSNQT